MGFFLTVEFHWTERTRKKNICLPNIFLAFSNGLRYLHCTLAISIIFIIFSLVFFDIQFACYFGLKIIFLELKYWYNKINCPKYIYSVRNWCIFFIFILLLILFSLALLVSKKPDMIFHCGNYTNEWSYQNLIWSSIILLFLVDREAKNEKKTRT